MAEPITIPISIFEVTIDYERPALPIWSERRALILQALFEALMPWHPNLDDIEIRTTGKLSEQGINFKLRTKLASFFFGPSSCYFTQDSVSWEGAQETLNIVTAALKVIEDNGIRLTTKRAAISLHLQPRNVKFVDLLRPFVPVQLAVLDNRPVATMASVVKWDGRKITLDGSGIVANAIFLRFEREFDAAITFEDLAHQLRDEEELLFKVLGIEEDRG